jgi:hypothetical protein
MTKFEKIDMVEPMVKHCSHKEIPYTMYAKLIYFDDYPNNPDFEMWCECMGVEIFRLKQSKFNTAPMNEFYEACKEKVDKIAEGKSEYERQMMSYGFSR